MATLSLHGLGKHFGATEVLCDVELSVADKEFMVFVGPSGCGKSTLLRIIAGLEDATSGHLEIDGKDVADAHPLERGISMVFQSYALYPHLSVFENLAFPLRVAQLNQEEVTKKVSYAAEILQITDRLQYKPSQLSGGQRQRVAIGRAIVRNPKIFLFDEPLSNLDASLRNEMRVELSRLHKQLNVTMIYVTHDQVEAMTMADRIAVLNEGRIQQFGRPLDLFHHPKNLFVASFIGTPTMNLLDGKCTSSTDSSVTVDVAGIGTLTLPVRPTAALGARQQDIKLGIRPTDLNLEGNGIPLNFKIEIIERLGNQTLSYGCLVNHEKKFCAMLPGEAQVWENHVVEIFVEPAKCHLIDATGNACERLQAPAILDQEAFPTPPAAQ